MRKSVYFTFLHFQIYYIDSGAEVAQSVYCLTTDLMIRVRAPAQAKHFPLASVSIPALKPTQPPFQWVPGSFLHG
jgi:hypothetical protein